MPNGVHHLYTFHDTHLHSHHTTLLLQYTLGTTINNQRKRDLCFQNQRKGDLLSKSEENGRLLPKSEKKGLTFKVTGNGMIASEMRASEIVIIEEKEMNERLQTLARRTQIISVPSPYTHCCLLSIVSGQHTSLTQLAPPHLHTSMA